MSVIGAIAFFEMVAIVHGILRREPIANPAPRAVAAIAQSPLQEPERIAPAPAPVAEVAAVEPTRAPVPAPIAPVAPPPAGPLDPPSGPAFLGPAGDVKLQAVAADKADPTSLYSALASAARTQALEDGILERLLVTGSELRASGNTQGALQAYREVESALPGHPRVLSEIATALGRMGLADKSKGYWERVEALGEIGAGPYFPLAGQQLRGETAPAPTEAATPAKSMKIGEIMVEEQVPTSEGQKVTLDVVIDVVPGVAPVGEDLSLIVNFYDRVAGGAVRPSTADTSYLYPTEPYDWKVDGTETIIVNYNQPVFTEKQKRELGERSFYGYAIELYYRDELQDKVAMPEDITALRFETVPGEAAKESAPSGPENALFPGSVIP